MNSRKFPVSRRRFLGGAAVGPALGGLAAAVPSASAARRKTAPSPSIYEELGVRTLINGQGVVTFYSCTLMPPEVHQAMQRASEHYVEIVELQRAVGARLAKFVDAEAAMVCSGSAACIAQATAGCIAGMDPDKIFRLPDTEGMKNEVIITHRSPWDRGIALTGAKLVVVQSLSELESAINEKTAMMEYTYGDTGPVTLKEAIAICKRRGVPFMIDGAATCPPFERLKTLASYGADLFCVSGGKGLLGPQCSGILFGRKDLIEAALHNGSPFEGAICRPMKVGKEEIVGALAAVEWSSKRDYQADCRVWESRLRYIAQVVGAIPGVEAEIYYRKVGNEVPHLAIRWDEQAFGLTKQDCIDALRNGDPHIEVYNGMGRELVKREQPQPKQARRPGDAAYVISITSNTLQPGDEKLVAVRLKEILTPASGRARRG
ncbi:MAG TPA: aminotransferase class V-fold PLP-dependent enzyme [Bryobacteraceae bacterium]|nr:aminotransferase class V-fold PLP-dependent enzyme [Bryobacteraceae bacterium]